MKFCVLISTDEPSGDAMYGGFLAPLIANVKEVPAAQSAVPTLHH